MVQQPVQVWKKWQRLLRTNPPLRSLLAKAWAQPKLKQLGKARGRWAKVCGPTTAVVATLLDLGWKWSMTPATMINLDDEPMELLDDRVQEALQADLESSVWAEAETKRLGAGITTGGRPNLSPIKKLKAYYLNHGLAAQARWLERVVCGGCYFGARRAATWPYIADSCRCPHCGGEHDEKHVYWSCPQLQHSEVEEIVSTNCYTEPALLSLASAAPKESYWLRGLLPLHVVLGIEPPAQQQPISHQPPHEEPWFEGEVATDGSGGKHTKTPYLRRCGWACAQFVEGEYVTASAPLEGPKQTSARAELFAVLHVLRRTKGNIQIWTDHQAIPNIFSRPQQLDRVELLDNSDLWQQIRSLVSTCPYIIEVYLGQCPCGPICCPAWYRI